MKKNRRMSKCNRLDLQTLGSQPVNAQKSPQSLPYTRLITVSLPLGIPLSIPAAKTPELAGPEFLGQAPPIGGESAPPLLVHHHMYCVLSEL